MKIFMYESADKKQVNYMTDEDYAREYVTEGLKPAKVWVAENPHAVGILIEGQEAYWTYEDFSESLIQEDEFKIFKIIN